MTPSDEMDPAGARSAGCPGDAGGAGDPARWAFLEQRADPVAVVTRKMEVVYLNALARAVVTPSWVGRRCWEVFPVGESACAAKCLAVKAVGAGDEIIYCEETIWPGGAPLRLGVAVVPLPLPLPLTAETTPGAAERALLLLRPRPEANGDGVGGTQFQQALLADARALREECAGR